MIADEIILKPQSGCFNVSPVETHRNQRSHEINLMFEKKFEYQKNPNNEWLLPNKLEIFKEYYQIDELQNLRTRLNQVKSKLNNYGLKDWSIHTRSKDPAGQIPWLLKTDIKAEFVTLAWCKFFECLNRFPIVNKPKINSLHLCEAPGAFIAALNHYLTTKYKDNYDQIQWKWLSTTLNPYYEGNTLSKMFTDHRMILMTIDHWVFHDDFTGNIIDIKNINNLQNKCRDYFNGEEVDLITADGSIDCIDVPDCQEESVDNLNFAEIVTALSILSDGGNFVIKLFTAFQATTVSKMFLFNCIFETVSVFKPVTSKRGNSEIYVICMGFKKNTPNFREILEEMKTKVQANVNMLPIFARNAIPMDFLFQHEICQRLFMNLQIKAIENNIFTYESRNRKDKKYAHDLRMEVCKEFVRRYHVQQIPKEYTLLFGSEDMPLNGKPFMYQSSHSERELLKATSKEEQVFKLQSSLNYLEKSMNPKHGLLLHENRLKENHNKDDLLLKLYTGHPISYLHNSLFMTLSVLFMRNKFQELMELDPLWCHSPQCDFGPEDEPLVLDYHKSKDDFAATQQQIFIKVLQQILNKKPKKIIFKDFPFVTHYSVSILRYLHLNIYSTLTVQTEPNFEVILEDLSNEDNLASLQDLAKQLSANKRILCVLDLVKLHRNAYSMALEEFNNLLFIKNCNKILTPKN